MQIGDTATVTRRRDQRDQQVTERVEAMETVPVMEAVWVPEVDPETGQETGRDVQAGEREAGTVTHVRYSRTWPDGSVTYGTAGLGDLVTRWGVSDGDQ